MKVFSEYAAYYNLLYKDKDYATEVDYVLGLIQKHSTIAVNSLLDLGCGTGRHDVLFAEKIPQVTGVDLSHEMIEIAKQNRNKNLDFVVGDVRNIQLNQEFDVIVSLFHVASYQTSNQDFENYLKTAYNHLKKGGLFIFDFWYGPAVLTDQPVVRIKRFENDEILVTRIAEPEIHYEQNIVDVNYEIIIQNKTTFSQQTIKEKHEMRYWFLPEFKKYFTYHNFKLLDSLVWLSANTEINYGSWYNVLILKKE